jgi:hypothetical protein
MGERKVLNRYVPPDFDPSIIPRIKRDREKLTEVRMMLPFSMRCNTCSEYMYRGKKFNSKKEDIVGETYMGIRKYRFYIKCSVCSAEITFKTDPKNSDYECEFGASRNFELWRDTAEALEGAQKEREEEDKFDSMKSLENRTLDSKLEIDVLDALDEIKAVNQRHERVNTKELLEALSKKSVENDRTSQMLNADGLTAEDEALAKSIKFGVPVGNESHKRPAQQSLSLSIAESIKDKSVLSSVNQTAATSFPVPIVIKKRRVLPDDKSDKPTAAPLTIEASSSSVATPTAGGVLSAMFADYGDDSDS